MKKFITKQFIASLCVLAVVGVAVGVGVKGADVDVTVTPGVVSVELDRSVVGYGIMLLNDSKIDPEGVITATAGTAEVDLNFSGNNATYDIGGTDCGGDGICTWTLNTTPGTDIYEHSTTIDSSETALTTSAQTLVTNLVAGTSEDFTLKMYTPTIGSAETDLGSEYETTVTITAISSI